ncbi:hypothetical protein, partial [Methanocalculus sp.]|uniref:hypothetical protein n=1 Tax=Methanocalculus sp. TaxID=2004547 RepID=UPI00260CAB68
MIQMDVPEWIPTFIISYASGRNYQAILSSSGDNLKLLSVVKEGIGAAEVVAMVDTPATGSADEIEVIAGDPVSILNGCTRVFDFVLLFPPNPASVPDLLFASALRISDSGALIALVNADFFRESTIIQKISESGFFCEAALTLRLNSSLQSEKEEELLIIIRRGEREMIMAGELTQDVERHRILLQNLQSQKNGKRTELGIFIRRSQYRSLDEILLEERISKLAEEHGAPRVPFSGITRSISTGACGTLQDAGRRIYLPYSPAAPPVISHEDLSVPPSDAACIL